MADQDSPLTEFEKQARLLAQWLDAGRSLNTIEQVSLENHLQVIHLSYAAWKHHQSVDDRQRSDT